MSNYADNKLIVNSAFGIFDTFSFTSFINLLPHKDDIDFHDESVGPWVRCCPVSEIKC